ncbi:MAG: hypothetical protein EOM13_08130, partial [Clostridia bacterium]|nr:hypothetical protein [Clostridia bacterium]
MNSDYLMVHLPATADQQHSGVRNIMRMKHRDYPYYETTKFEDFRIMVENVATRYPDRVAISYKDDPSRPETVDRTYAETRDDVRDLGTGLIRLGLRDQHVALIGEASYDWICSYFALMAIGAVVVPIDRDLPIRDITDIMNAAGCRFIHYSQSIEDKI